MERQVAARRFVSLGIAAGALLGAATCAQVPAPDPGGPKPPPAAPRKPAAPSFAWYSELGDTVVAKCDAIVTGKVGAISELRGGAVVSVAIEKWFYGERAEGQTEVTLLAHPDDFFEGNRLLLFLQRFENGGRYTYLNRILESDPDFESKRKVLEQTLALHDLKSDDERRYAVRRRIYEEAGSTDAWTRGHVLRELAYLRKTWPDLMTRDDLADLRELAKRSADEKWKKALLAAIEDKERNS